MLHISIPPCISVDELISNMSWLSYNLVATSRSLLAISTDYNEKTCRRCLRCKHWSNSSRGTVGCEHITEVLSYGRVVALNGQGQAVKNFEKRWKGAPEATSAKPCHQMRRYWCPYNICSTNEKILMSAHHMLYVFTSLKTCFTNLICESDVLM